ADVPHVADLAGPQREPAAIQGRHCRGCRRPQRADPLQSVLGHGNRGKAVEKERAQGRGRTENRRTPDECLVAPNRKRNTYEGPLSSCNGGGARCTRSNTAFGCTM